MGDLDPSVEEWHRLRMQLFADVAVWSVPGNTDAFCLEREETQSFFHVGYAEYLFISLLNGQTTAGEAYANSVRKLGKDAFSMERARQIVCWLVENRLAFVVAPSAAAAAFQPRDTTPHWAARLNPFWMRFPLPINKRHVRRFGRTCSILFSPFFFIVWLSLLSLAAISAWSGDFLNVLYTSEILAPGNWLWLIATSLILKAAHEAGHAAACYRFGGQVKEIGIAFVLFLPMPYVDVSSVWRMSSLRHRLLVASAGMMLETAIASVAVLLIALSDNPLAQHRLANVVMVAGMATLIFNLNPLMRFDGYYILADLLRMPNLYGRGSRAVRLFLFGEPAPPGGVWGQGARGWRLRFELLYGLAALAWRIFVCLTLLVSASMMFAGFGILLAIFGLTLWIGLPLRNAWQQLYERAQARPWQLLRAALGSTALTVAVAGSIFWIPLPFRSRLPAVVRASPEAVIRARTDGIVSYVAADEGEHVAAGQLLLRLSNPELDQEIEDLKLQLAICDAIVRQAASEQDTAAQETQRRRRRELQRELSQRLADREQTEIRAPHSGCLVAPRFRSLLGTYFHEGDRIGTVDRPETRELLAMVAEADLERLTGIVEASVRGAAVSDFRARFVQLKPRGSKRITHPAFSAVNGGPLAVRNVVHQGETTNELVDTRFEAIFHASTNAARQLRLGQTCYVELPGQNRTLFDLLTRTLPNLLSAEAAR